MIKFLNYLALFSAISIASTAAYFSVLGLATIFAGAWLGIVIMTGVLEFGKLVTAAYLHIVWDRLNYQKYFVLLTIMKKIISKYYQKISQLFIETIIKI